MSKSFLSALKWSTASEIIAKAIQPVIFIILARILKPEEYGVMAAALMVISFTQIFWEAGMGKAIIQTQMNVREAANAAFWINLVMALVLVATLLLLSDFISINLFHDSRVSPVLQVMSLQILMGSLGSIQTAILQKELKFHKLFWIRIATVLVPGIFSIPLAIYGLSYWSIVVGTLVGQTVQTIFLWSSSDWRPAFSFNFPIAKDMLRFGLWVSLTGLLVWFYLWADSFVVGAFLGARDLGLFRTANTFVLLMFDGLFAPILPVLYSYFSGISSQEKIFNAASTTIRIISIISIPLAFLLFRLSVPISDLIFGEKWIGIAFIIGLLGLMRGYGWLVGINGEIYRSVGKPHYETSVYAFSSVFFLIGYLISIRIGFKEFVYTRLGLGMLSLIPHFYLFRKVFRNNSVRPILRTVLLSTIAGIIPFAIGFVIPTFHYSILYIVIVSVLSVSFIALFIFLSDRRFLTAVYTEIIKKKI